MQKQIRAIVFDLDGTLVHSAEVVLRAFQHALAPFGYEITYDDIEKLRAKTAGRLFEDYLDPERARKAYGLLEEYTHEHSASVDLFAGLDECFRTLKERKLPIAVWTGRDRKSALRILEKNGVAQYFESVVGGCQLEENKPHPEGLLLSARNLNVSPEQILMVGDHPHDIEGARRANTRAAWVKWATAQPFPEHMPHAPDVTFESVHEFWNWIRFVP